MKCLKQSVSNTYKVLNKFQLLYMLYLAIMMCIRKYKDKILKKKFNFCGKNIFQLCYYFLKYSFITGVTWHNRKI